jgi:hypothetical protein
MEGNTENQVIIDFEKDGMNYSLKYIKLHTIVDPDTQNQKVVEEQLKMSMTHCTELYSWESYQVNNEKLLTPNTIYSIFRDYSVKKLKPQVEITFPSDDCNSTTNTEITITINSGYGIKDSGSIILNPVPIDDFNRLERKMQVMYNRLYSELTKHKEKIALLEEKIINLEIGN